MIELYQYQPNVQFHVVVGDAIVFEAESCGAQKKQWSSLSTQPPEKTMRQSEQPSRTEVVPVDIVKLEDFPHSIVDIHIRLTGEQSSENRQRRQHPSTIINII